MLGERAGVCGVDRDPVLLPADRDLRAVGPPGLLVSSPGFARRGEVPLVKAVRDVLFGGGEIAFRTAPLLELTDIS